MYVCISHEFSEYFFTWTYFTECLNLILNYFIIGAGVYDDNYEIYETGENAMSDK